MKKSDIDTIKATCSAFEEFASHARVAMQHLTEGERGINRALGHDESHSATEYTDNAEDLAAKAQTRTWQGLDRALKLQQRLTASSRQTFADRLAAKNSHRDENPLPPLTDPAKVVAYLDRVLGDPTMALEDLALELYRLVSPDTYRRGVWYRDAAEPKDFTWRIGRNIELNGVVEPRSYFSTGFGLNHYSTDRLALIENVIRLIVDPNAELVSNRGSQLATAICNGPAETTFGGFKCYKNGSLKIKLSVSDETIDEMNRLALAGLARWLERKAAQ